MLSPFRCAAAAAWGLGIALAASAQIADPFPAKIPHGPVKIELQPVATGLVAPNTLLSSGDGSGRLLIVDQPGQVRLVKNGTVQGTPFLDLSARVATLVNPGNPNGLRPPYDERGLLGLALDPDFNVPASAGYQRVFTYHSEAVTGTPDFTQPLGTSPSTVNHHGVINSWRVSAGNADVIDPASKLELLRFEEPQSNHNGGQLAFGPDDLLYVGLGDGGGANDNNAIGHNATTGNGQDTNTYLGKVLRIDVNGSNSANGKYGIPAGNPFAGGGGLKEIFAWGFRNPFRFGFDGADLLVADVGQNKVEELNRVEVGKNYGWRYKEGQFKFNTDGTISGDLTGLPAGLTDPILQYDHDEGISIIGGFVYHGSAIPELAGKYVFGDFSTSFGSPAGRLFYADLGTGEIRELILGNDDRALGQFIKGFGVDEAGEIYLLSSTALGPSGATGGAYRIVAVPEPTVLGLGVIALLGVVFRRRCRWAAGVN